MRAPAFNRMIVSGHPPQTAKDRYHLNHFIALQAARGQRFREDLIQTATLAMRRHLRANYDPDQVRDWLAERGDPHEPEDVEAFVESAYGPNDGALPGSTPARGRVEGEHGMSKLVPGLANRTRGVQ